MNHLVEGTGRDGRYRIRYRDRGLGTTGPLFDPEYQFVGILIPRTHRTKGHQGFCKRSQQEIYR